jgi:Ser/Thr protein kinase RdoA (MazF antagonist)
MKADEQAPVNLLFECNALQHIAGDSVALALPLEDANRRLLAAKKHWDQSAEPLGDAGR